MSPNVGNVPYRKRGRRSAELMANEFLAGHRLAPHKTQIVRLAARLLIHADNISSRLLWTTETREDGESRAVLATLLSLSKEAREHLRYAMPNDDPEPDFFASGDGK